MAWSESNAWMRGSTNRKLYQALLDDATTAPARNAKRKKVVTPEEMPWEMARQGLLKHLLNEGMNTRMETVDAYMQIIPPGSRSGKHRHLAEECLYVVEGRGHDAPGLRCGDYGYAHCAAGGAEAMNGKLVMSSIFRPTRSTSISTRAGTGRRASSPRSTGSSRLRV
jgi:hypothetical protein